MAKKILSLVMALALIVTCMSGLVVVNAEAANYLQIDLDNASGMTTVGVASTTAQSVAVGSTGYYGHVIAGEGVGFTFAAAPLALTAADIDNGTQLKVTVEYFLVSMPELWQNSNIALQTANANAVAISANGGMDGGAATTPWGAKVMNNGEALHVWDPAAVSFTLGADNGTADMAKAILNGDEVWLGSHYHGATGFSTNPIYIRSIMVEEAVPPAPPDYHTSAVRG